MTNLELIEDFIERTGKMATGIIWPVPRLGHLFEGANDDVVYLDNGTEYNVVEIKGWRRGRTHEYNPCLQNDHVFIRVNGRSVYITEKDGGVGVSLILDGFELNNVKGIWLQKAHFLCYDKLKIRYEVTKKVNYKLTDREKEILNENIKRIERLSGIEIGRLPQLQEDIVDPSNDLQVWKEWVENLPYQVDGFGKSTMGNPYVYLTELRTGHEPYGQKFQVNLPSKNQPIYSVHQQKDSKTMKKMGKFQTIKDCISFLEKRMSKRKFVIKG